jgi:hypothetical protein
MLPGFWPAFVTTHLCKFTFNPKSFHTITVIHNCFSNIKVLSFSFHIHVLFSCAPLSCPSVLLLLSHPLSCWRAQKIKHFPVCTLWTVRKFQTFCHLWSHFSHFFVNVLYFLHYFFRNFLFLNAFWLYCMCLCLYSCMPFQYTLK